VGGFLLVAWHDIAGKRTPALTPVATGTHA